MKLAERSSPCRRKKYAVIVADPEWQFEFWSEKGMTNSSADNHYRTSVLDVIKARDVAGIVADDAVLFLSATVPMLPQALEVMAARGFVYKSKLAWVKDKAGTGYWFRSQHEFCWSRTIPASSVASSQCAKAARHSAASGESSKASLVGMSEIRHGSLVLTGTPRNFAKQICGSAGAFAGTGWSSSASRPWRSTAAASVRRPPPRLHDRLRVLISPCEAQDFGSRESCASRRESRIPAA